MKTKKLLKTKGIINSPCIYSTDERKQMIAGCRWVDEAISIPEYIPNISLIDWLNVDYIMHGDDVINDANGESIYTPFIKCGKYKLIKKRIQTHTWNFNNWYHWKNS